VPSGERTLISIAYRFEQHARPWQEPHFLTTVDGKPCIIIGAAMKGEKLNPTKPRGISERKKPLALR